MLYIFLKFILYGLFKIVFRFKIYGGQNFPRRGSVIVASNHASFFDPIIVGIGAPRQLYFMARDSLFRFRPFAILISSLNALPLKREGSDINAFKLALKTLSRGRALLIFPEGTRSVNGDLQKPRYGIGFLEARSGAMIVPCYIKGSFGILSRHSVLPRIRPVSVYFGKPLKFDRYGFSSIRKKEFYAKVSHEVMACINELKRDAH